MNLNLDAIRDDIEMAARPPEMARHVALDHGPELLAEAARMRLECREWEYAAIESGKHLARLSAEADEAQAALDQVRAAAIWSDPERCGGEPCVRGTRVPVEFITDLIADGCDDAYITRAYPSVPEPMVAVIRALLDAPGEVLA